MGPAVGKGLAWAQDDLFLNGDGVNQPEGVINAACAIFVTRTTGGDVSLTDVANMWERLAAPSMQNGNAVWLASPKVVQQLALLSQTVSSTPIPADSFFLGVGPDGGWRLGGLPLQITSHLPDLGVTGDLVLADFSMYAIGERQALMVERAAAGEGFGSDTSDFKVTSRIDGRWLLRSAVTPGDGSRRPLRSSSCTPTRNRRDRPTMAKTATAPKAPDPAQVRRQVIDRVLARRPEPKVRTYANVDGRGHDLQVTDPPGEDRMPPRDLGEWADDRVMGVFGGRLRLNPPQQAAYDALEAMRSGDQAAVRNAVQAAARGLDATEKNLVYALFENWRSGAPSFALEVTIAAAGEARRLGWNVLPRRSRLRLPEPAGA